MSVMFANRSQQPAGAGHLLEFQAGRTLIEPGSTPEKRKAVAQPDPGQVYIKHSQDDQLLHFCWKNRQSNNTELDLIIFPGETEFLRISECKDGRVFMLKFKNSQERHLFWMQEPNEEKDEEIRKKTNELLSNAPPTRPAATQASRNPLGGFAALQNAIGMDDMGAIGNMDQNQLMRLFSLMNGGGNAADLLPQLGQSTTVPSVTPSQTAPIGTPLSTMVRPGTGGQGQAQGKAGSKEATPSRESAQQQSVSAQMLSQIISALPSGTAEGEQQQQKNKRNIVELSTVLTRENTKEVVSKYKDRLSPHVPDQAPHQDASTELNQTVGNPQFQQAADFLGQALQLGQMGAALEHFQLDQPVVEAAKKGDLVEFAEKLTAQEDPKGEAKASAVDAKIEAEADEEENIETSLKKEEEAQKKAKEKEEAQRKEPPKRPPREDDNMELD